jgi:hypothetical protein
MLMVDRGKGSYLHAKNEYTSRHGEKYFTHDNVTDIPTWLTEMNHQTQSENVHWNTYPKDPLEAASPSNQPASDEQEDKTDHAEGVANVSCRGHIQFIYHLQK